MGTLYIMGPVVLMPYNLPPWKCMKDPYMILSLFIPGHKAPKNKIDVCLQSLVDDLKNYGMKASRRMTHQRNIYLSCM